jgi:hypothetical protein
MFSNTHLPILFAILILFTSCVFSLDDENRKEINRNVVSPEVYNLSASLEHDTINFWFPQWFTFDFTSSDQAIFGIKVYVNDTVLSFTSAKDSFLLFPTDFAGITYAPLKLEIYTSSGTGSLADKFHFEGFKFEKNLVLGINQVEEYEPNPRYTVTESGFLRIDWDPYPGDYFYAYIISANYSNEMLANHSTNYILERDRHYFIDSLYVGGPVTYSISRMLEVDSRYIHYGDTTKISAIYPLPEIFITNTSDSLTVSWSRSPFNCIYRMDHPLILYDEFPFRSDSDTSVTFSIPGIGDEIPISLYLDTKKHGFSYLNPIKTISKKWTMGKQTFGRYDFFKYHPKTDCYYLFLGNDFLVYKASDLKHPLYTKKIPNYFRAIDFLDQSNTIALLTSKLSFYEMSTMNLISEFPVPFYEGISSLSVINDSIAIFNFGPELKIYNYRTSTIVNSTLFGSTYYYTRNEFLVSEQLRWFVFASWNRLCIMENMGDFDFEKRLESNETACGAFFDPFDRDLLWVGKRDNLLLYDLKTMQIIEEYPSVNGMLMNIDPFTNRLLVRSRDDRKIFLFNLTTRQTELTLPYITLWDNSFDLVNNTLYENIGYSYDLGAYLP